jgi:hypothetical protein
MISGRGVTLFCRVSVGVDSDEDLFKLLTIGFTVWLPPVALLNDSSSGRRLEYPTAGRSLPFPRISSRPSRTEASVCGQMAEADSNSKFG